MARATGTSGVAGTVAAGGASSAQGSSGRPASGGIDANDSGGEPAGAHAGSGLSSAGGGGGGGGGGDGGADSSPEGLSAGAGGLDSMPSCPARAATFPLGCADVVARWSPVYAFDSSQWRLDASALEHPFQSGSFTFFNSYSTSEFPVCGVVSVELSDSLLLATPSMDSHYLITAQIARFEVSDVCGNHYVYEPSGRACGSIAADEASDWRGRCVNACPGACD